MKSFNCVVKVQTEAYKRGETYFYGKSLRVIKRLTDLDVISEDVSNIGTKEALENILNLSNLKDGTYCVVVVNRSYDIESGYLDGWNWGLVPYKED